MTRIVLTHGIAQQFKGAETLTADWYPALCDGVGMAGGRLDRHEVAMAFYGDLFRPVGHRGLGAPQLEAADVEAGLERDLLIQWWESAAREESQVAGPETVTRLRTPDFVQRALNALSHSTFFANLSEHLLISSARQVRRYFTEPNLRALIQNRFAQTVTDQTEVIIAHSLGSIVAYEALCAHPDWPDLTLVTLGSPLALRGLVFERLIPTPSAGHAQWPVPVKRWSNIADRGDIVTSVKMLAPSFGSRVADILVHNGAKAHDVRPYLTALETGQAIADGLNPVSSSSPK